MYRYTDLLYVEVDQNDKIIIMPQHQKRFDDYESIIINKNVIPVEILKIEYPGDILDEYLGMAVMEAFTYCTSNYKRE